MKALTFTIHLAQPLLATQPQSGEANSATSFLFIPGSMLRGALIHAYLKKYPATDLAADSDARRLFFDGQTCYLNAYPLGPHGRGRMLPRPLSWFSEKDQADVDGAPIYDFAIQDRKDLDKPKPPSGEFCHLEGPYSYLHRPIAHINVHNASSNRNEKSEGDSQVYRYEALAAGQQFMGVILANQEADLTDTLKPLLETASLTLGGSQTGGYGRIDIHQIEVHDKWTEYTPETPIDTPINGSLIVTLLSDTILRNPDGQASPTWSNSTSQESISTLAAALGLSTPNEKQPYQAYQQVRLVGGFNRKWGLPLPQDWAIKAGSVFCLPAGAVDQVILQRVIEHGLGERRTEGFGRIAFNWHTQATRQKYGLPDSVMTPPSPLSAGSRKLAQELANRRLRADLEQGLIAAIVRYQGQFKRLPSSAQLSRLRLAARHALLKGDLSLVREHMDRLKGAKAAWQDAEIKGKSLFRWVLEQSQLSGNDFMETFELTGGLPQIATESGRLTDALRVEYCARLIDGVMKLAIEKKKEEQGGTR